MMIQALPTILSTIPSRTPSMKQRNPLDPLSKWPRMKKSKAFKKYSYRNTRCIDCKILWIIKTVFGLFFFFSRSIAEVEPMEVTVNRPITYQIEEHGTNQGKRKLSDSRGFTYTVKVRDK